MWEESLLQSNFSVALPNCVQEKERGNQNLQSVDKTQEPQTERTLEA